MLYVRLLSPNFLPDALIAKPYLETARIRKAVTTLPTTQSSLDDSTLRQDFDFTEEE